MRRWFGNPKLYAAIVLVAVIALVATQERPSLDRVRFSTSPEGDLVATVHRTREGFSVHLSGIEPPEYDAPRIERPEVEVARCRREPRLLWKGETELQIAGPDVIVLVNRMKIWKRTVAIRGESPQTTRTEGG